MRHREEKSPHRLSHDEHRERPLNLSEFGKGDVVVRQGTPCMVVDVSPSYGKLAAEEGRVWLCNLQTGSVWTVGAGEQVWPCREVQLSVKTSRTGE